MCRLLGLVSRTTAPLTEHLADYLKPFAAMSSHHCDGWGLTYWNDRDDMIVAKAPEPAMTSDAFWAAAEGATTDAALMHLRRASVGMAPVPENTHPFVVGSVSFAHNGYFGPTEPFDEMITRLGGRPSLGVTDSERYFRLVLAGMRVDEPVVALRAAAERITATAEKVESLNALMLTSRALYAFAYADPAAGATRETAAGTYQMHFRHTADTVVVASDGWQAEIDSWEPLANGSVLEVTRSDLRVTVHRGQ